MSKSYLLEKLFTIAFSALGAITIDNITISPAQAGTLGFSNGGSSFVEEFNGGTTTPATFSVEFSPDITQAPPNNGIGSTSIDVATGEFSGPFNLAPPIYLADIIPTTVTLNLADDISTSGIVEYVLDGNTTFNFPDQDVQVTVDNGSIFGVEIVIDNGNFEGVEVELLETAGSDNVVINGELYPCCSIPNENSLDGIVLAFEQTPSGPTSEYAVEVDVSGERIPEPTSTLGIFAIGSLCLGLMRKKELQKVN